MFLIYFSKLILHKYDRTPVARELKFFLRDMVSKTGKIQKVNCDTKFQNRHANVHVDQVTKVDRHVDGVKRKGKRIS